MTLACPLCLEAGGSLIWENPSLRLIRAAEPLHPAFYRVVWQEHVAEFTELTPLQRLTLMDAVSLVEQLVRAQLAPDKINLASLGNVVPHLHWHVVARWSWDAHWPQAVWAPALREPDAHRLAALQQTLPAVDAALRMALQQRFGTAMVAPSTPETTPATG